MKRLFIMRGTSGAGKSTWVRNVVETEKTPVEVCSADDYFLQDGKYTFDLTKIGEAHKACFSKFLMAVSSDKPIVIVDNTGIKVWEISPYVLAGETFGYDVKIVEVKAPLNLCCERNVHGVPAYEIGRMAESMRRETLPPMWKVIEVDNRYGTS